MTTPHRHEPSYVFDTSTLSAFARVGRIDILEHRYGDRALWTLEVAREIERGARKHRRFANIDTAWLGTPVRLDGPEELLDIERVRLRLGGRRNDVDRHRGEAATLVTAIRLEAVAVLDDGDARRLAVAEQIPIVGTLGILRAVARDRTLPSAEAWDVYQEMLIAGERLPSLDRLEFNTP